MKPLLVEHFLYGHKFGLIKSPGVDQLIDKKSLKYLCGLDAEKWGEVIQTISPGGVVAITYLQHNRDEYERKTIHNHTLLLTWLQYLQLHPPAIFEQYFIKNLSQSCRTLPPLRISEPK